MSNGADGVGGGGGVVEPAAALPVSAGGPAVPDGPRVPSEGAAPMTTPEARASSTPAADRTGARWALRAAGDLRLALAVRAGLALAGAAVLAVAAVLVIRHGVRGDTFPPFVSGAGNVIITRYSGPWIAGGSGLALLAGLLLVAAATDLWRRRRLYRAGRDPGTPRPDVPAEGSVTAVDSAR